MEAKLTQTYRMKYQLTTWQGAVEVDGTEYIFRYSEDDNGSQFFIFNDGWEEVCIEDKPVYEAIYYAVSDGYFCEGMEPGEVVELDVD